jgi:L-alanine-DL-glutamate epimerase-like enolase superfamily enzyme
MRISSVHAYLLSYPLPQPLKLAYHGGERSIVKRDAMLIRVEADNGLVGYAPGEGTERAKQRIDSAIGPFLEGRTLSDPDVLRVHFLEGPGRDLELARLYCGVEIALYDLAGKAKDVPISELLGGRVRDRIHLYGSAGMYMAPEKYAEEARAISTLGFRAYKMRAGIGPEQDLDTVRQMREAVGPDFDLMVDAHTWWRMGDRNYLQGTIDKLAEDLGAYNIAWLEDPLPPDDHEGYRRLKELDIVTVAAGVHEPDEPGYLDLISTESVDCVQMDLVSQGGYHTARRLLTEIFRAGLKFAFHTWGTALDVVAAAQLGVCWPDQHCEWLEYPCYSTPDRAGMYPFPLAAEVLKEPLQLDHGDLVVPNGPGLGVEIDESVIGRYPWIPGEWSFLGMESLRDALAPGAGRSPEQAPSKPVGEAPPRARRPA